jgi:hypothetical protein
MKRENPLKVFGNHEPASLTCPGKLGSAPAAANGKDREPLIAAQRAETVLIS